MLTIEKLTEVTNKNKSIIQAVADIEAIIQPQDAWVYTTIQDLLEQESINLITASSNADNQVMGYCLYQAVFEQAEILRIGTHPNYQRQGVASKLFFKLNKELQNSEVENLLLEVRADNAPAIALYEQQGFSTIHKRRNYYQSAHQPAVDGLVMQLKLCSSIIKQSK